ncbi:PRC-barrel domain-containing protein [Sulfitobacter mediterraneus]|uniref:PRC-barrel domain-containing protein n=1 Tax=Sulfitobacter mediterraneus TaxID=83219 RepID=UPI001933BC4E|nr:PRC-barrel domain-containing protein [Sulfitobacter mediterraneus]MBM1634664.1 PRC-barrel domain-containing protein [Sulfitobacter mediterraneus]MBM1642482.1 PRC-barrel domain-containing protein [Sulfitobacter mediterraneus]MBM1646530.1 PRC-barrel domain-containing protein [Sulfitobacter mediterraneus]MBM1650576.1 PRC-barrel domain-containing protein [Sulfitobacter mediterraneus]MBM1654598.1 PRC-barrel domain-containing protein [Sulfitobacter mediterraneus]
MKRFLTTTAVALTLSSAAFAGSHSGAITTVEAEKSDFFASDLIGMRIYNSETDIDPMTPLADGAEREWDDIGEINDIIISENGDVRAVILGVGGFLGLGERDVSVSMDDIKVLREEGDSNDRFLVVTTSKEMLEKAPAFERQIERDMEQAATNIKAETHEMAESAEAEATDLKQDLVASANEAAEGVETRIDEVAKETEAEAEQMTAQADEAIDAPVLGRPMVERDGFEPMDIEVAKADPLTAEKIQGAAVMGQNDETVGEVDALVLTDKGEVAEVVINVGGFLGLGEKPVAVPFEQLQILRDANGDELRIYIDANEAALKAKPEYKG